MGQLTIDSNAIVSSPSRGTFTNTGGAPDLQTALSDNSDTTYGVLASAYTTGYIFGAALFSQLDDTPLPAGARVLSVQPQIRAARTGGTARKFNMRLHHEFPIAGRKDWAKTTTFNLSTTITTFTGPAESVTYLNQEFSQEILNKCVLEAFQFTTTDIRLYQFQVLVNYDAKPVTTVTSPSGTITDNNSPVIGWTYFDDLQPQDSFQVQVLQGASVIHDSGVVKSTSGQYQLPIQLANNAYTFQVRTSQKWTGKGGTFWSDWSAGSFTISVEQPVEPALGVTSDATNARVKIEALTNLNLLGLDANSQEKVVLGASTPNPWSPVSNCTLAATGAGFRSGSKALAITASNTSTVTVTNNVATFPYGFTQAAEPNVTYKFSAWFRRSLNSDGGVAPANRNTRVGLAFYDGVPGSGGSIIGSTTFSGTVAENGATYVENSVSATAPALTKYVLMTLEIAAGAASNLHFVDDMYLRTTDVDVTSPNPGAGAMRGGFYDDIANLLPYVDSDIETSNYSWALTAAGGTLSFDVTQSRHGLGALKFVSTTVTQSIVANNLPTFPASPGDNFTLVGSVRGTASTGTANLKLQWFDITDTKIGEVTQSLGTFSGTQWRDVDVNVTAPAGTSYGKFFLQIVSPTSSSNWWFDRIGVMIGTDTPWIDGFPKSDGPYMTIEFSEDAGVTWFELATFATDELTDTITYYDYEIKSGGARRYRAFNWKEENDIVFISPLSVVSSDQTITLTNVWLHTMNDPAGTAYKFKYDGRDRSENIDMGSVMNHYSGRHFPQVEWGEKQTKSVSVTIQLGNTTDLNAWYVIAQEQGRVVFRDARGRRLRARISAPQLQDSKGHPGEVTFSVDAAGNQPWPPEYDEDS